MSQFNTGASTGTDADASATPNPQRKKPRRVVTIRQAARFNSVLALSDASPSGLVWKGWNRGVGTRSRNAGDPAGCEKKAQPGCYVIGLDGVLWHASTIRASLQALHSVAGQTL